MITPNSKKALVTGASRGIGAAVAARLARRGYQVWLAARSQDALSVEVERIRSLGGVARSCALDASKPEAVERQVGELDREVGGFDLVVANAGIGGEQVAVADQTLADARAVMEVNYLGALATLLPCIPGMTQRGAGQLVGVSSLAGQSPLPSAAGYGTSKAALSFFLASAAIDLLPRGITVTDVRPGFVKTALTDKNQFEMPFLVPLERAADIIDRGIAAKKRVVRFPLPLVAAISAGQLLPDALRDRLVNAKRPF